MTEIVVREAEIGDAPAIGSVHVRSWQEAYRGQVPDTYLDRLSIGQRIDVWRDMLATGGRSDRLLRKTWMATGRRDEGRRPRIVRPP